MNLQQVNEIKAIPFENNQQLEESKQKPLANSLQLFDKVDIFNQISKFRALRPFGNLYFFLRFNSYESLFQLLFKNFNF